MADTCQAGTLATAIKSPNVVAVGSSRLGQNSYAAGTDFEVGLSLIDRFTAATLAFLETAQMRNAPPLSRLFDHYNPSSLLSNPLVRADLYQRPLSSVPITDFFGSVLQVQVRQPSEQYQTRFESAAPATQGRPESSTESKMLPETGTAPQRFDQPQQLEMRLWCTFFAAVLVLLALR
jgi:phosphatidylinositol glycan class K